jgi:hypothetical protein
MRKECKDHLGNAYASITDMCKAYDVKLSTFCKRIQRGWTLEKTLTQKVDTEKVTGKGKTCKDHLGNTYSSISDMCRAYGIQKYTFDYRFGRRGMTVEQALTESVHNLHVNHEDLKQLTTKINESTYNKLKGLAKKEKKLQREIVEQALAQYLTSEGKIEEEHDSRTINERYYMERDAIVRERQKIYDTISGVLTDYETGNADAKDLYETLCLVQNKWEISITAQVD